MYMYIYIYADVVFSLIYVDRTVPWLMT
jgi:hypothetical protein